MENAHFQKVANCMELKQHSNERLEFLGDGILEAITKMYLYKRFPDADEGFMTEKKICLVKNEHIGKLAYKLGLQQWFVISRNAEEKKTRINYKKLGCLFEAFLGALFLDANLNPVEDVKFVHVFNVGVGFQYCQLFIEYIY
jgi:ribonuclease-3